MLRAGPSAKASIAITAQGSDLDPPALPLADAPTVAIQLRGGDGGCWGATYTSPPRRNDGGQHEANLP